MKHVASPGLMEAATQKDKTMSKLRIILSIASVQEQIFIERRRDGNFISLPREEGRNNFFPEEKEGDRNLSILDMEEA